MRGGSERIEDLLALRGLSSLRPRYPIERSLAAIESLGPEESSRFLDAMRMRTLVARRLDELPDPSRAVRDCRTALSAKVDRLRHMHQVLAANLNRLNELATRLGRVFFGGKGIGAHATYTDQSVRDFNDLDIFVRARQDATALSRVLLDEFGYQYQSFELPWFKFDELDRLCYGQIALVAPPDDPDLLNIDIHFGDYSVRHCARLGITQAFSKGSPGLGMLAPEENLACIVNNAAGDYFVTAKDTNDLLMALSLPTFDVDRFAGLLRRSRLDSFFGFVAATLRASTVLTEQQESRLRAIPTARTLEPAPRPGEADWNRRCLGTTVHAFAVRRPAGLVPAFAAAAGAFSYYRRRFRLALAPNGRSVDKPVRYNPWTCIRLVPLPLALGLLGEAAGEPVAPLPERWSLVDDDPDFVRFDTPAGTYFRIEGEFFLATVEYKLAPDVIRHVAGTALRPR